MPNTKLLNGGSPKWMPVSAENSSLNSHDIKLNVLELDRESRMIDIKFGETLRFWQHTLDEARSEESSKTKEKDKSEL